MEPHVISQARLPLVGKPDIRGKKIGGGGRAEVDIKAEPHTGDIKMAKSRLLVCLCWVGSPASATHRRRPATAPRVRFELLGRPPGPVRASLGHLDTPDSSDVPIWTQGLARTPVQHEPPRGSDPILKPSTEASLPEAGLQGAPPTPADGMPRFYVI